jgi:hypothetical protein
MTPEDIELLKRIKRLLDDGVLTAEEFEFQKQLLLKTEDSEQALSLGSENLQHDATSNNPSIDPHLSAHSVSGGGVSVAGLETAGRINPRAFAAGVVALIALIAILVSVTGGGDDSQSTNPIDEKMNVSVKCVVTDLDVNEIVDVQEISETESLWTIAASSYFYFNRIVRVTNYDDEPHQVFVEYRFVDDNGKVFDTSNFLEYVDGGETQIFEENQITQAPSEIVLRGNSVDGEMTFDCPVTRASL